jgi:hypothetical protein
LWFAEPIRGGVRNLVVYRQLLREYTVRDSDRTTPSERRRSRIKIDDLKAIFR